MLKRIEIFVFLNIVCLGGGAWIRGERFGLWMSPLGTLRGVSWITSFLATVAFYNWRRFVKYKSSVPLYLILDKVQMKSPLLCTNENKREA